MDLRITGSAGMLIGRNRDGKLSPLGKEPERASEGGLLRTRSASTDKGSVGD